MLSLTPREYRLLELLMRNPGRAVSRDTILESVWGFDSDVNENTLEVFMRQLRLKVDNARAEADPHRSRIRLHDAGALGDAEAIHPLSVDGLVRGDSDGGLGLFGGLIWLSLRTV